MDFKEMQMKVIEKGVSTADKRKWREFIPLPGKEALAMSHELLNQIGMDERRGYKAFDSLAMICGQAHEGIFHTKGDKIFIARMVEQYINEEVGQ